MKVTLGQMKRSTMQSPQGPGVQAPNPDEWKLASLQFMDKMLIKHYDRGHLLNRVFLVDMVD